MPLQFADEKFSEVPKWHDILLGETMQDAGKLLLSVQVPLAAPLAAK